MRRQVFLKLSGVAAMAFPWPTLAQTDLPIVAVLTALDARGTNDRVALIRKGLQEAGLAEGVNYAFAIRFSDRVEDRLPRLTKELVAFKPRLMIITGSTLLTVHKLVPDLPIVFSGVAADPIRLGLAQSYEQPGGNWTGNVLNAAGGEEVLAHKRIGLLKELVPNLRRIGYIGMAAEVDLAGAELNGLRSAAGHFGFEIVHHAIQGPDDIESAVGATNRDGVDAFYVSGIGLLYTHMTRVLLLIAASRKPAVGTYPEWGRGGLFLSYAPDPLAGFRGAGIYAAKILGGDKPGDLPIELASKFILVVNAKTAKQLGINVPPTFLADEVIE